MELSQKGTCYFSAILLNVYILMQYIAKTFRNIQKHSESFRNTQKHSESFRNIPAKVCFQIVMGARCRGMERVAAARQGEISCCRGRAS